MASTTFSFVRLWLPAPRDQAPPSTVLPASSAAITAFNILSATGFLMLLALLLTAWLAPGVRRVSTWYTYILAWIVFCVTPFPVVGHQGIAGSAPPGFAVCLVDQALMYASRPLAAFASLSLTLHLYLNISTRLNRRELHPHVVLLLMAFPPILYLIIFLWTLIMGIRNPSQVVLEPGGFYCHVVDPVPAIVGAALVVSAISAMLVIEALMIALLCQNWSAFRSMQKSDDHGVSLSMIVRVSVFGLLPFVGLILSFMTYMPNLLVDIWPVYNILLASLPPAAALLFGTQSDILDVWNFWRRKHYGHEMISSVGTFSTIGPYSP